MRMNTSSLFLRATSSYATIPSNKTLQASPAVFCRDAQTAGLLFSALFSFTSKDNIDNKIDNTPAMPLYDAHFGGFFTSGGCL